MKGLAEFTKTTLIGGLLIVLPIYLSILLLAKTLSAILALLSPVTATIPAGGQFRQVIALLIVFVVCFVAGIVVRTGPGLRAKNALERSVLERIPGLCAGAGPRPSRLRRRTRRRVPAGPGRTGGGPRPRLHHRGAERRPIHRARFPRCRLPRPARCSSCLASACTLWTCPSLRP